MDMELHLTVTESAGRLTGTATFDKAIVHCGHGITRALGRKRSDTLIGRKAHAADEEVGSNPRSRSALLRVAEKVR